jgi:uncharacterized protein YukE
MRPPDDGNPNAGGTLAANPTELRASANMMDDAAHEVQAAGKQIAQGRMEPRLLGASAESQNLALTWASVVDKRIAEVDWLQRSTEQLANDLRATAHQYEQSDAHAYNLLIEAGRGILDAG